MSNERKVILKIKFRPLHYELTELNALHLICDIDNGEIKLFENVKAIDVKYGEIS